MKVFEYIILVHVLFNAFFLDLPDGKYHVDGISARVKPHFDLGKFASEMLAQTVQGNSGGGLPTDGQPGDASVILTICPASLFL